MFRPSHALSFTVVAIGLMIFDPDVAFASGSPIDEAAALEKQAASLDREFARRNLGGRKFDINAWRSKRKHDQSLAGPIQTIGDLVHSYPLIGMTRRQVHRLLGIGWGIDDPDSTESYQLDDGGCTGGGCSFELVYKQGLVQKYRLTDGTTICGDPIASHWVEKNPS